MTISLFKKTIFILVIMLIIIFGTILILTQKGSLKKNTGTIPFPSPVQPTYYPQPTQFSKKIHIISTSPVSGETNVSIAPVITIVFSRPLNTDEQKSIKLTTSPSFTTSLSWSSDSSSVSFLPSTSLAGNQTYSLTLTYGQDTYAWTFTTKPDTNLTNQDFQGLQTISDKAYSDQQNAVKTSYPWIDSLPLSTASYFTYFDLDTDSFTTHMYYKKSSPLTASQENAIQKQVLDALQNIGVDTTKYKFVWQPIPVSG